MLRRIVLFIFLPMAEKPNDDEMLSRERQHAVMPIDSRLLSLRYKALDFM